MAGLSLDSFMNPNNGLRQNKTQAELLIRKQKYHNIYIS